VRSDVDKIVFTGSVRTGKRVMAAAADTLTPVVLELGGKDPMIVCADADLDRAARGAVWGAFQNSGQTCMSVERVYVDRSVADGFIDRVIIESGRIRQDDGSSGGGDIGSMTFAPQVELVEPAEVGRADEGHECVVLEAEAEQANADDGGELGASAQRLAQPLVDVALQGRRDVDPTQQRGGGEQPVCSRSEGIGGHDQRFDEAAIERGRVIVRLVRGPDDLPQLRRPRELMRPQQLREPLMEPPSPVRVIAGVRSLQHALGVDEVPPRVASLLEPRGVGEARLVVQRSREDPAHELLLGRPRCRIHRGR